MDHLGWQARRTGTHLTVLRSAASVSLRADNRTGGMTCDSMAITATTTSTPAATSATGLLRIAVWFPTAVCAGSGW